MKTETLNLGIKGEVTILKNKEIVFQEHNEIQGDALEILLRGLTNVPEINAIDQIFISGDGFNPVTKTISDTIVDVSEMSVTFITVILEDDFEGTIWALTLKMGSYNLEFAQKLGLSIEKDARTQIEIRWKVKLTNC